MSFRFRLAADQDGFEKAREALARTGRLHLPFALSEPDAETLRAAVAGCDWTLALNTGAQGREFRPEHVAQFDLMQATRLLEFVHAGVQGGFQYLSDSYRVSSLYDQGVTRTGVLASLYEAFNGPDLISFFRGLTGDPELCYADMQATRYRPGHFLTTHDDVLTQKHRRYAYVLNLTKAWVPDWGGLLLFHGPDGRVEEGYAPAWNALNIFRVGQMHAVSYVAPFAAADRLSITGWLRTQPDPGAAFGAGS